MELEKMREPQRGEQKSDEMRPAFEDLIGETEAMQSVFERIVRAAKVNSNVLITGEKGTEVENIARAIHRQGPAPDNPFMTVNCSAMPSSQLKAELFGQSHDAIPELQAKKHGLFAVAGGGTLFLNEVDHLDMQLQGLLLQVLQNRKRETGRPQMRLIAASEKDLQKKVEDGSFREDLLYELNVIPIDIPPLRHRRDDIPLIADHFRAKYAKLNGSQVRGFTPEAVAALKRAPWEGNVRELETVIERVVALTKNELIDAPEIPLTKNKMAEDFFMSAVADMPTIDQLEKRYIRLILDKTGGRKEKAAQILGINRRTLYRKEREYGFQQ